MGGFGHDERGVSEVIGYVLSVAIVSMLMLGVVVASSSYFEQRQQVSTGTALDERGQQLSRTVGIVDRLVRQSDSSGEIGRSIELPAVVGEERYRIRLVNRSQAAEPDTACDRQCLLLSTDDVTRRVYVSSVTKLRGGSVVGQSLYVVRESGAESIRIRVQR